MNDKAIKLMVSIAWLVPVLVFIAPLLIQVGACSAVYGETEIPECLKTE